MSGRPLHVRPVAPPGWWVGVMLVGGWLGAAAAAWPAQPVMVESAVSHVDYKTNTAVFKDIAVSQGDTRVTAEQAQATGLGFNDSTWTFEGNVTIRVRPQARLRAQRAIVEFRNSRVTRATITGRPAVFEQQRAGSRPSVHGEADEIVYNAQEDTLRLSGEAWVSGGHEERISGPLLTYSISGERLEAVAPGGSQGVHITITPQELRKSAAGKAAKPPKRPGGPR